MQQAVPVGFGLLRKITRNEAKNFRDRSSENSSGQPALKCSSPPIFSRGKIVLEVKNLNVSIGGRKILDDLDLTVGDGEVAALMGPNGSGKSTLSHVIAGRKDYIAETGDVLLNGESILNFEPEARAAKGLFLAFQYPVEIPGVATLTFLKAALNAQRKQRGQEELSTPAFMKCVRASAGELEINQDMLKRALNAGFSGGEKKRMEILQMALLEPDFAILDETDSGLDIDALRVVADGVNALRSPKRGFLIITHYQRVLNHVVPDTVHVMAQGRIVRSGGEELAVELEKSGYRDYVAEPAVA
jgi:Fe-S cluster assembly ATP-binding protein